MWANTESWNLWGFSSGFIDCFTSYIATGADKSGILDSTDVPLRLFIRSFLFSSSFYSGSGREGEERGEFQMFFIIQLQWPCITWDTVEVLWIPWLETNLFLNQPCLSHIPSQTGNSSKHFSIRLPEPGNTLNRTIT